MTTAIIEERHYEPLATTAYGERRTHKVSWGALFAGAVVALASWILLYAIGLAIGLSSIDPADLSSAKVAGIGTGIYSILAPLIALFCGGIVASRLAGIRNTKDGTLHGVVVWGITTIAGLFMIGMLLQNLVGGIIGAGQSAVGAATSAAQTGAQAAQGGEAQGGGLLSALGLDYDTLLAPANQRLAAEGLPPVRAEQLQAAVQDAVPAMVASGSFDRSAMLNAIAANTALSRAEAEQVAASVEAQFATARERFTAQASTAAATAADVSGKAFWAISAALLLGLISAAAGGAVGTPGKRERKRERELRVNRTATAGGPDYVP